MTNTSASAEQLRGWVGRSLVDPAGDEIGRIEDIYVDEATGQPAWLAVTTGWFGNRISFVPLAGTGAHGDDIVSHWDRARVKDAPHADPEGRLTQQEESDLYGHYGLRYAPVGTDTATGTGTGTAGAPAGADWGRAEAGLEPATDHADASAGADMVRPEEELQFGDESHESGRPRLRRWVETEHVTRTVPGGHDEADIGREPIGAMEGADLTESDREMVLTEEQIVANQQVVPRERVHLEKEAVTEDVPMEADLRRERVEAEGPGDTPPSPRRDV